MAGLMQEVCSLHSTVLCAGLVSLQLEACGVCVLILFGSAIFSLFSNSMQQKKDAETILEFPYVTAAD